MVVLLASSAAIRTLLVFTVQTVTFSLVTTFERSETFLEHAATLYAARAIFSFVAWSF
jgi:hypothetical protein